MVAAVSIIKGKAEMAYVGETPWHGLGQQLTPKSPIEVWAKEAGMNWKVQRSRIRYATDHKDESSNFRTWDDQHVLFRSDTKSPLGIVSDGYKIVQPVEVLEFFRSLTESNDMQLETAGTLFGGRRYWALAKTAHSLRVAGTDVLGGYLLLATSADGSLATTGKFTSIRVVCNNTLSAALLGRENAVKVYHNSVFDQTQVKVELGLLDEEWSNFGAKANALARRKISRREAIEVLIDAYGDREKFDTEAKKDLDAAFSSQKGATGMAKIMALFDGAGIGADMKSSKGTAWGLVNAATQYFDHEAGRSQDRRLSSAWFGKNERKKNAILGEALKLVA